MLGKQVMYEDLLVSPIFLKTRINEKDPNGIGQHEAGAKLDHGKTRLGLVLGGFAKALEEVGKVGTFGANKYTDNGWKEVPSGEARYTDALYRHLLKEITEGTYDKETQLQHAAHAAWNALARLELQIERLEKENTIGGNKHRTVEQCRESSGKAYVLPPDWRRYLIHGRMD